MMAPKDMVFCRISFLTIYYTSSHDCLNKLCFKFQSSRPGLFFLPLLSGHIMHMDAISLISLSIGRLQAYITS